MKTSNGDSNDLTIQGHFQIKFQYLIDEIKEHFYKMRKVTYQKKKSIKKLILQKYHQ